jgi:hypothetical protein
MMNEHGKSDSTDCSGAICPPARRHPVGFTCYQTSFAARQFDVGTSGPCVAGSHSPWSQPVGSTSSAADLSALFASFPALLRAKIAVIRQLAPAISPAVPDLPGAPAGPAGPIGPAGPATPATPYGPAGPTAPVAPVAPAGPAGPIGPTGPAGPCAAVAPAGPCGQPVLPGGLVVRRYSKRSTAHWCCRSYFERRSLFMIVVLSVLLYYLADSHLWAMRQFATTCSAS